MQALFPTRRARVVGYGSVWLLVFTDVVAHEYETLLANDAAADASFRQIPRVIAIVRVIAPRPRSRSMRELAGDHLVDDDVDEVPLISPSDLVVRGSASRR